jgi:serine/threonine protein kinase
MREIIGSARYEVVRELSKGGYGITYLAKDLHLPSEPYCVVKKFAYQSHIEDMVEVAREAFKKEAKTLEKLGEHSQIPKLLAYIKEEERRYIVQEFIEGQDLSEEIANALDEAGVIKLLIEILTVLQYVHSEDVLHRDLKPSNIRRRVDGKIVLIDFGAAKEVRENGQISVTSAIGTPGYRPFEQANGNPNFYSDIYAVGMIAVQSLTKIHPQNLETDPTSGELCWRKLVNISEALADILSKMTRLNYSSRYQSTSDVLQDLSRLQNQSDVNLCSLAQKKLLSLQDDIRILQGGIVLPTVKRILEDEIDNFENLYRDYTASLNDKSFSAFLRAVCVDQNFQVDAKHPAKLVLKTRNNLQEDVHSEIRYKKILSSRHCRFKLENPEHIAEVSRQVSRQPIYNLAFESLLELVSQKLPSIHKSTISDSLLAFWSAGCFDTKPEIGSPFQRSYSLKPNFSSEQVLLKALHEGVRAELAEALFEIDEEINEEVLMKLLPPLA